MTIKVYENFISEEEQAQIIEWAQDVKPLLHRADNLLEAGATGGRWRRDLHFLPTLDCLTGVQLKIRRTLSLQDAKLKRSKLVIHEAGANTSEHVDKYTQANPSSLSRANILVRAASEGGIFEIEGVPIKLPERGMIHYVGDTAHEVTKVLEGERIILVNFYTE